MGLFNSLKGKLDVGTDDSSKNSNPDPSSHDGWSSTQEKRRMFGRNNDHTQSSSNDQFSAPPGPPPNRRPVKDNLDEFAPPPGPPPSKAKQDQQDYAPPPGPPPSQSTNPPPYHDWTVIPDTSLLPPPPSLPQDYSPTNNASYDSAERAHAWCASNPAYTPSIPSSEIHASANAGQLRLETPLPQLWKGSSLRQISPSSYLIKTAKTQQDAIIQSTLPLYFAAKDHPFLTDHPKTIYYEIRIRNISNANSGIAIGYAGKPYPPWRLPGWHRASLGVHGDDGRRFVNDPWGGNDFVSAFASGETIGIGMTFGTEELRTEGPEGRMKTRAFVTRGGKRADRDGWDIDEERDVRDEGADGLMGEGDLYPAIGVFGGVEFEVNFGSAQWLWQPRG